MKGDYAGFIEFIVGLAIGGLVAGSIAFIGNPPPIGTQSACRAANPGYECITGWVKGDAFK